LGGAKVANGSKCHANAKRTTDRRQQKTFRQQLTKQPLPSATQGDTQSQFVPAAYVHLDAVAAEMRYAAAAHPPMLLLRNGVVHEVAENGLMLGAFHTATYEMVVHALRPGDRLLLYTDGIMEAANDKAEEFGRERLCALLRNAATLSHDAIADLILTTVQRWSAAQEDDLTLLVCDYQRG
jgi:sigma-B regulation protein RsbU (phosphoserine phosphatase)